MDFTGLSEFISSVGFPVVCVIGMAWFIYQIFKKTTDESAKNMEKVQARCKEREDKLYSELDRSHKVNEQAISTIAHYAEKLDTIQEDIKEIKTDITVIMTKQ